MSDYYLEIQKLVNSALEEMTSQHKAGKLIDSPVSNNHFLVRWITKSLKQQTCSKLVTSDLIRWQKMGRSQGSGAALPLLFRKISGFYRDSFKQEQEITDKQIEDFLDTMEAADWEVSTSEPLVNEGKVQILTELNNSLALCSNQCESCFDGEVLIKPISWFVRGNHQEFIKKAWEAGFVVHKRTDYKSNVKYHGEYLIYPQNKGEFLAEIPLDYQP
ncbi:DUF2913 family protein [Vibrio sp.]|nr:DUF2913 family protein [Vibrio sp.]